MDKRDLSAEAICKIIEKCKKTGVTEFSFGDLVFKFQPNRNEAALSQGPGEDHVVKTVVSDLSKADDDPGGARLVNEQNLLEAEEAQQMIDDPLAFERSQMRTDIERERELNGKAFA